MRGLALAAATLLAACGQSVPPPATLRAVAPSPLVSASPDPGAPPVPPSMLPALDALAARGPSVAAGMHEVSRGQVRGPAGSRDRVIVPTAAVDTCVRVGLAAEPAVRAWLADARAVRLADEPDASAALLGPLGPVCIRKGDTMTLHLESAAPFEVRFVAWASP